MKYERHYCPKCTGYDTKEKKYLKQELKYFTGPLTLSGAHGRGKRRKARYGYQDKIINGFYLCEKCNNAYYTVTLKRFDLSDITVEDKHKWDIPATNTIGEEHGKSSGSGGVK